MSTYSYEQGEIDRRYMIRACLWALAEAEAKHGKLNREAFARGWLVARDFDHEWCAEEVAARAAGKPWTKRHKPLLGLTSWYSPPWCGPGRRQLRPCKKCGCWMHAPSVCGVGVKPQKTGRRK